jgi:hypothetical protein
MTSIIKVDNLQNQCGANIISESANVITIGASGDTVTLAAGASQSGFGRSGSVNWDTTKKTTGFTAVSGNGYFCDTTSAAFTVTLPATPSAGDIVAIADYANTSATNNITVGRNGSNIDGEAFDAKIRVNGQVYTLVYVDATEGWKTVNQTFNQISTAEFVAATGGCIVTSGDFKIHTFTGPGTFTVTNVGNPNGSTTVDYLVVAAGGGGTIGSAGAGGAGGFRQSFPNPATAGFPITAQAYPITVGSGGTAGANNTTSGGSGNPSIFSTITSAGGGGGGKICGPGPAIQGLSGGSGGGTGGNNNQPSKVGGGAGNTPPVAPPQGNNGGNGSACGPSYGGGGGGGASAVGVNATGPTGGNGGAGSATLISGSSVTYAGGGGGGSYTAVGTGGAGGGGNGATQFGTAQSGTVNTGGGGGSTGPSGTAGTGGSGIVIIRYKYQ